MANFLKDFSLTSFSTVILTALAFFNNIIITRQIGPDGRGKYAIVSNLVILLALLLGEGIRRNNTLLVPEFKSKLNVIITQNAIYVFASLIIFGIFYLLRDFWTIILPNISTYLLLLGLIISLFTIFWQSLQAIFLGLQNILNYNILQLLPISTTFLINAIGIYFFDFGLISIITSLLIGTVLTSIVGLYLVRKDLRFQFPDRLMRKRSYSVIFKSTFSATQLFLIIRGDIFLVNFFLGSIAAGIYSVAALFSELLQKFPNIAGLLLISKSVADKSENPVVNTSRLSRVIFFINFLAVLVLFFFGKFIVVFLFGFKFVESYQVILYLIPALFFFGSGSIFYSYFISKSYPVYALIINAIVSIFNITLNLIFIPVYGLAAAAVICSLTYFLWTVLYCIYFHHHTKTPYAEIFFIQKQDFKYLMGIARILR